jgi:hypothetical protein
VFRAGSASAYLTVIAKDGGALLYSTLYSGRAMAQAKSVAADGRFVVIAGITDSSELPGVGPGSFQPTKSGIGDGFVARFDPDAAGPASLVAATYLGRSGNETIFDVAVGPASSVYAVMVATSNDMPTPSGFQACSAAASISGSAC